MSWAAEEDKPVGKEKWPRYSTFTLLVIDE